jgi:hypothetical protein
MALSRRFFLKSGTLTALAAGVAIGANRLAFAQTSTESTSLGYQIPIKAQQEPTYMFTRATFEPYVGGIFQAPNAQGRLVNLTLMSATTNKPAATTRLSTARARDTDSFSLLFKASALLPPFTSIHQISHPALGKFDLFLVPRLEGKARMYEAVFNHI